MTTNLDFFNLFTFISVWKLTKYNLIGYGAVDSETAK